MSEYKYNPIMSPRDMWSDDLSEAMTTVAMRNLGTGRIQWLRQAAKPHLGEGRFQVAARAEIARRERLENES